MAYSKAYQSATGTRGEDEALAFFGENRVATPSGSRSLNAQGGKTQPTIDKHALHDPAVGKPSGRTPDRDAYNPNSYNVG